ncbi:MAG: peptidoglycan DD-metalloendopeptidase family protein [Propionibacteriales bacterium]|nr:peptidoglycan DD-metalloendopeptidase family protein [Propionibacteriales bacterium]
MTITKRLAAAVTGLLAIGLLSVPVIAAAPAQAQRLPQDRPVTPPNVYFPVSGKNVHDLKNSGKRPGTEIKARCGNRVRASHPGIAVVTSSPASGPNLVAIVTTIGRLTTWYGYMKKATVTSGQLVQAGQVIGRVGQEGKAQFCSLYFAVRGNTGTNVNPSKWLNRTVGKPVNTTSMFDSWGIVVASLNTLGASHTKNDRKYPTYDVRTPQQVALLNSYSADVVGLQEFQQPQRDLFLATAAGTFGIYPDDATLADPSSPFVSGNYHPTENSIIWRNSTMELLDEDFIRVPYFEGYRNMPVVLLRERVTGRTAWFINVHNPASGVGYGDQTSHRAEAIAIERAKVIELRATGRPVFVTGDFNDRKPAFCGLTAGMLTITPDSIPSVSCAPPPSLGIDWIFTAGQARFTRYARDWRPKDLQLTDHPIVWARAHIAD